MKRLLAIILVAFVTAFAFAPAAETISGYVQVAFGKIPQADGSVKDMRGMWLPYTARRIEAQRISPLQWMKNLSPRPERPPTGPQARTDTLTQVYKSDAGSGYGINGFDDASDLDDMNILAEGVGKSWQQLTFGIDTPDSHHFIIRWIVYEQFNTNAGPGAMAFSPYVTTRDFGVIWNGQGGGGTWNITISVAAAGCSVDQQQIYVAQQFRSAADLSGEGPFDYTVHGVFNTGGAPTTGFSDGSLWIYDGDQTEGVANGIYSTDESDYFEEGPSNLLFGIKVNVNVTTKTITPYAFHVDQGMLAAGGLIDIWQADQSYLEVAKKVGFVYGDVMQVEIDGKATSTAALSYHFLVNCSDSLSGAVMSVYFYNYTTQMWDLRGTYTIGPADTVYDAYSTNNPQKYISSTKFMRAQIRMSRVRPSASPMSERLKIDQASWVITL